MKVKINSTDPATTVVTLDLQISNVMQQLNRRALLLTDKVCAHYQKAIINNSFVLLKSDDETVMQFISDLAQVNNNFNVQIIEK